MNAITTERKPQMQEAMLQLKTKLKATWESGDYGHFATYMETGAFEFLDRLAIAPGTRVLDVACGAGQIAIPAARRGVRITGVDIAANLIDRANARAKAENIDARFEVGDAEQLAFDDASFDLVVSLIGAMFAPRPDRVAAELLRVCRPGGRIAMANWTPEGHVGQMFKIIGKHVPPSPLMVSPVKWGDAATVRDRLQAGTTSLQLTRRTYPMRYPFSPAEVVDFFRTYYGPTFKAFAALDRAGQEALHRELTQLWDDNNQATDGSTQVDAEYLEVIAIRK